MAIIQTSIYSAALNRRVHLCAIVPVDRYNSKTSSYDSVPEAGYKTLYLIHGITDDCTDWITGTCIKALAMERNLVVIMPDGQNSFYVNEAISNNNFSDFVGIELVEMTRKMFHLSSKREDTFLGGQSMGGFGTLLNGLKYHDTFGSIIAFSSAVHLFDPGITDNRFTMNEDSVFGNMKQAENTDKNPWFVAKEIAKLRDSNPSVKIPRIYMDCGRQDILYESNIRFLHWLRELGYDVTYQEDDGVHGWDYWNKRLPYAIDWLPLEEKSVFAGQNN